MSRIYFLNESENKILQKIFQGFDDIILVCPQMKKKVEDLQLAIIDNTILYRRVEGKEDLYPDDSDILIEYVDYDTHPFFNRIQYLRDLSVIRYDEDDELSEPDYPLKEDIECHCFEKDEDPNWIWDSVQRIWKCTECKTEF